MTSPILSAQRSTAPSVASKPFQLSRLYQTPIASSDAGNLSQHNEIGFDQNEAHVSDLDTFWSYSALHYYKITDQGTFGGHVNIGNRFGETEAQYQLEEYPKLGDVGYLNLSMAYARHTQLVFPQYAYTVEPYFNLPNKFELSLGQSGVRALEVDIFNYTGSIGRYYKDNFFWFRPHYYHPTSSHFYEVGATHYGDNSNNYLTLRLGIGKYPDIGDVAPFNQIILFSARNINLSGQYQMSSTMFIRGGAGYSHQEFGRGKIRDVLDGTVGIFWRF